MAKKKPGEMPKPRHGWAINPKTRVKDSAKKYARSRFREGEKNWEGEFFD